MIRNYTTILIGNGLGMAIDHEYFAINRGLETAWNNLSNEQQQRITNLNEDKLPLNNECQIIKHYDVLQACLMLTKIEKFSKHEWLLPEARNFPSDFRKFIADTAWHFFNYPTIFTEQSLLDQLNRFIDRLIQYIKNNNTHIVTLNYDGLIYERIVSSSELQQVLTDGFYTNTTGFHPSILSSRRGYYLHLHGSPLFYTDLRSGVINKKRQSSDDRNFMREHIILCQTNLKRFLINSSPLLSSYWDFYKSGLENSHTIIVIGYSGKDIHVNKEISKTNMPNRKIIIVEHSNQGMSRSDRENYWKEKFNLSDNYFHNGNLIWIASILDYEFIT